MLLLSPEQAATLKNWFLPERPGPLIGLHVLQTGHGVCYADRWPHPRALLSDTAGNISLAGDPNGLQPDDLRAHVTGFVEAPAHFVPLLRATFPTLIVWERVVYDLAGKPHYTLPNNYPVRRLTSGDAHALAAISPGQPLDLQNLEHAGPRWQPVATPGVRLRVSRLSPLPISSFWANNMRISG